MAVSNPRIVQIFETSLSKVCGCTQLMYDDVYMSLYVYIHIYYILYVIITVEKII